VEISYQRFHRHQRTNNQDAIGDETMSRFAYSVLASLSLALPAPATSAEMKCIAAPAAASKDLKAEIDLKIAGIKKYAKDADFSVRVGLITNDLYAKYPNADRLILAQAMLASVCSLLNSVNVPDREKIEKYSDTEAKVLSLFANPRTPASGAAK
jgi:hypothetical protein